MFLHVYIRKLKSSDLNISSYRNAYDSQQRITEPLSRKSSGFSATEFRGRPHNVEKISLDPLDDNCSEALYPVGPGLIERFAGFDVRLYLVFIQPLEENLRFYRTGEFSFRFQRP